MPAYLIFTTGSLAGTEIPLTESRCTVGRDPSVDIVVPAEDQRFVSRRHAVIVRDGSQIVVEDLGSSNGTLVNGHRVHRAALADGDEIQFGRMGPIARFVSRVAAASAPEDLAEATTRARAVPPAKAAGERSSVLIRRVVSEALASSARRDRRRRLLTAGAALAAALLIALVVRSDRFGASGDGRFRQFASDYGARVVLIEVGVRAGDAYVPVGTGSGFFATDDGLVVTNKHVVQPQLFSEEAACLLASYQRVGSADVVVALWPGTTPFRQHPTDATGDHTLGFSTTLGTLSLAVLAPDTQLPARDVTCTSRIDGSTFALHWQPHVSDNNDLAALRVVAAVPPRAIPLGDREPAPDEPVMVFGFPEGFAPLETTLAEPIRRVGRVLRIRDTIQIDAVVLRGNSGGPLLDERGTVVGVTTRGPAESLNSAIKVEHVRRLLARAGSDGPPTP